MKRSPSSLPIISPPGLRLRIERLIPGGLGLARAPNGKIALARHVVTDDEVEVLEWREHPGHLEVVSHRVASPSALRVEASCPIADRCGGCDWMTMNPDAQAEAKLGMVRDALLRTARIRELPEPVRWLESPRSTGYRTRIRLQLGASGALGFFPNASHDLVMVEACAVSTPAVNRALTELRAALNRDPNGARGFDFVEIRAAPDQPASFYWGAVHRSAQSRRGDSRPIRGDPPSFPALEGRYPSATETSAQDPRTWQRFPLVDSTYLWAPPGTFTQVNWEVNQRLIQEVITGFEARGARDFVDLYSGSGNFSLPLGARGFTGIGVEQHPLSVRAATRAAREQALERLTFIAHDVAAQVCDWNGKQTFDFVLVDPPRAGVKRGIRELAALARRYLVICSCDPVTLARDLGRLLPLGFELEELCVFDMFPQTHHVETLAWLRRRGG